MKNLLICIFSFIGLSAASAQVNLVDDFGSTQNENGFQYLAYGDSRPVNVTNPSSELLDLMFAGNNSIPNGSEDFEGDVWVGDGDILPYIQNEERGFLALHPESQSSGALAAALLFNVDSTNTYLIEGDFARANNFRNAGNGVDVGIYLNEDFTDPIFETSISADHDVSLDNLFGGSGVASFNQVVDAMAGDRLSFFVFADSQGQDQGFDVTALRGTISAIPEPASVLPLLIALAGFLARRQRDRGHIAA